MMRLATPHLVAAKGVTPIGRGKLYQGTQNGILYESVDGGKTWQKIANFGEHCAIVKIATHRDGSVALSLACIAHTFDLHSQDARLWRTV
jgi:hypothetical protein